MSRAGSSLRWAFVSSRPLHSCLCLLGELSKIARGSGRERGAGGEGERGEERGDRLPSPEMEKWILKKRKYLQSGGLSPSNYNFKVRERPLALGFSVLPLPLLPNAELLLMNLVLVTSG